MHFEKFLLENYIASDEGQKVYYFFQNIGHRLATGDENKEIVHFINSLLNQPIAEQFFIFEPFEHIEHKLTYPPFSEFEQYFSSSVDNIMKQWNVDYRGMLGEIPQLSLKLFFLDAPAYAFPYLYPVHFNVFQEIFQEFDIYLPPLPGSRQYKERCYYYLELCRSLYDFRQKYELSPVELCVFLYGFAPKFLAKSSQKELPQASKVWLVGANTMHKKSLENISDNSIISWLGNERIRHGDILFIYQLAPHKKIQYMCYAYSDGYDDPFHYYLGKVWLTNFIKLPDISFENLKSNEYFKNSNFIKTHMHGINQGQELSNQDYDEIKKILKKRKFDISLLPETISYSLNLDVELNNEHDIEIHLLEPLLDKLGVKKEQITRQMPLRMGRGVRYYPDYVINATCIKGSEQGKFIWEAKYRIVTKKDFEEAFYQAKSYALRLSANGLGLASYEGVWIALQKDNYQKDKVLQYTWSDLENKDTYTTVVTLLKKNFA